jgi:hypothetical protein
MIEAYHKRKNFEHPMHSQQLIDINNNRCPQLGEGEFKFVSNRWGVSKFPHSFVAMNHHT